MMTNVSIYTGIDFLMIAGAILALHQLSEMDNNQKRFTVLRNLGAKRSEMKRAL